jgi:hypothetical protein
VWPVGQMLVYLTNRLEKVFGEFHSFPQVCRSVRTFDSFHVEIAHT